MDNLTIAFKQVQKYKNCNLNRKENNNENILDQNC